MRSGAILLALSVGLAADPSFAIRIVDGQTGRGVPLVELRTSNGRVWHSDSNGVVAVSDDWAIGQDVLFEVRSHGYRFDRKVLDKPGVVLRVQSGKRAELRISRVNIAERLYRITGAGTYSDSLATGFKAPIRNPLLNGKVTGQDTAIATPFRGKLYWFWGDTFGPSRMNFNVSGAVSMLPQAGGLDPSDGIDLTYFVDETGFSRPMLPLPRPGLVWLEGLMIVKDPTGQERLVATYTRVEKLNSLQERGVAVFDESAQMFKVLAQHPPVRNHRSSHPVRVMQEGEAWWYLYPTYRVADDWAAIQDASKYEAYVCESSGCSWKAGAPFLDVRGEERRRQYPLIDADTGIPAEVALGSIAWNAFRQRWIMLAGFRGDVYYSEAAAPEGPWNCAKKVVQHDNYNFYNVVHHPFFDQAGGRTIYFEGTYTDMFMKNSHRTPLYEYNQIMYRLTLDDPRLKLPAACLAGPAARG